MEEAGTRKVNIEKKYCPKCYRQYEGAIDNCPDDNTILRGPKNDPFIGKVFAERYHVEAVLGLGGMSIVYKARHKLMERTVAIKMLHNMLKEDVTSLERFKLEAQAASSLSHQNVITVYDFGVTPDGDPFFVMDCLEGESLKELIDRKGRVPYERALPIFRQICDGLDSAHKKGIVHRDLKPANVVLIKEADGAELVKLVDFGIAKMLPQAGKEQQQLTKTGEVFGSPIYMSPEQCLGKDLDTRSDLYALGCLMYETLSGEPPFTGESFLETMNMHVNDKPKAIVEMAPDVKLPAGLEAVIKKCIEKEPADRFQTAGEIRDALSAITAEHLGTSGKYVAGLSGATTAVAPCEKKTPVALIVTSVIAMVSLVFFAFVSLWPGPAEDRGTLWDKMIFQLVMSDADNALKEKNFSGVEEKLNYATNLADRLGDGITRQQVALKKKAELYNLWEGHADDLERTNAAIAKLEKDRINIDRQKLLEVMASLDQHPDTSAGEANLKLRAVAQVPIIVSTAARLDGKGMCEEAEDLLSKALAIEKKLLGDDSTQIAELELSMADCFVAQRKYPEVRPYLVHACSIYKKTSDQNPANYVKALTKLGQFDLDRSEIKLAEAELKEALEKAQKLEKDYDLVLLCMRSYADLLDQTGRKAESVKQMAEADEFERKHKAELNL